MLNHAFSPFNKDLDGVEEFIRIHKDKLCAIGEVQTIVQYIQYIYAVLITWF